MPVPHCKHCGYCLANLPDPRCPECGRAFDLNDAATFNFDAEGDRPERILGRFMAIAVAAIVALTILSALLVLWYFFFGAELSWS